MLINLPYGREFSDGPKSLIQVSQFGHSGLNPYCSYMPQSTEERKRVRETKTKQSKEERKTKRKIKKKKKQKQIGENEVKQTYKQKKNGWTKLPDKL